MIQMTRVRLINWHNFVDNLFTFNQITYLIGVNAVGKTTILDAIRYCLTTNKRFNALGNQNSGRTLQGSVHGKQRGENIYTRRGHTVSYIGIEFFDRIKGKSFVITVRIESESPEQELRHIQQTWYVTPLDVALEELPFIDMETNAPSSRDRFSLKGKKMPPIDRQREAQNIISQRLGIGKSDSSLGKKFSDVFPMGTSLDAMKDFRTFINDYILPQPEIDLDALQKDEQELERLEEVLADAKERADQLSHIVEAGNIAKQKMRDVRLNEGFVCFANYQAANETSEQIIGDLQQLEQTLARLETQYTQAAAQAESAHGQLVDTEAAFRTSNEAKMLEILEQRQKDLNAELRQAQFNLKKMLNAQSVLNQLFSEKELIQIGLDPTLSPDQIRQMPESTHSNRLEQLHKTLNELEEALDEQCYKLRQQLDTIKEHRRTLILQIEQLEKGNWVYPDSNRANTVKEAINQELTAQGFEADAKILCELLMMNDISWQDCVESCLGNRRFDILVSPQHYPYAKIAFERLGDKVGRVSLLDSPALERDRKKKTARQNSLAEQVSSENLLATAYITELLGNIICCTSSAELEHYPHSATKDLLRHYPYRLERLRRQTSYIGLDAKKRQLNIAKETLYGLEAESSAASAKYCTMRALLETVQKVLHSNAIDDLTEHWDAQDCFSHAMEASNKNQSEIQEWKNSPLMRAFQLKIDAAQKNWEERDHIRGELAAKKKNTEQQISSLQSQKDDAIRAAQNTLDEWESYCDEEPMLMEEIQTRFSSSRQRHSPEQIVTYQRNYQRQLDKAFSDFIAEQLIPLQQQYNQRFVCDIVLGMEGLDLFQLQYDQLVRIELERYHTSLQNAKERCRERFRKDILFRMKDDISNARRQFRNLNRIMENLQYGEERYSFKIDGSTDPERQKFYRLITDKSNELMPQGDSLDAPATVSDPAYESQIDEFVDRIVSAAKQAVLEQQHGKKSSGTDVSQWADYRYYLDYDMEIYNTVTKTSVPLSAVSGDSSGGENQAPFYIAICASLLQIYNKCDNSIRLILLDEAFSKMTSDRIEPMMKMLRGMNLQVILISTVEKASAIHPYCDVTYSIIKNGSRNSVAPFYLEPANKKSSPK